MTEYTIADLFTDIRQPLEEWAAATAAGRVDPLLGACKLYRCWSACLIRQGAELPVGTDDDFAFLCGLESELDRFPPGDERALWAADALVQLDPELESMRTTHRSRIESIARSLRERTRTGCMRDHV